MGASSSKKVTEDPLLPSPPEPPEGHEVILFVHGYNTDGSPQAESLNENAVNIINENHAKDCLYIHKVGWKSIAHEAKSYFGPSAASLYPSDVSNTEDGQMNWLLDEAVKSLKPNSYHILGHSRGCAIVTNWLASEGAEKKPPRRVALAHPDARLETLEKVRYPTLNIGVFDADCDFATTFSGSAAKASRGEGGTRDIGGKCGCHFRLQSTSHSKWLMENETCQLLLEWFQIDACSLDQYKEKAAKTLGAQMIHAKLQAGALAPTPDR